MLFRKASKEIVKWIESGKDALLVAGARQVGKTYLIRELLKERKIDYIEFNFVKQPGLLSIFKPALEEDEKTFLENLRIASRRVLRDDTVVFFDEIQECKEIVTIVKFLVEHGKYSYVMSGSNDKCIIWDATYCHFWHTCPDDHEHVFEGGVCVRCGYQRGDVPIIM